ncbi:ABC-type transport auxiliary lipoprotein family protein [Achromobacter sp. Marseille-Q4962]|uniref:ABC-type transport auxiliary lipoprotein family protein n=1 Tax=Achromobacter sp. Marseille-Q4962 TaxID=2942202 RepID=UPI002072D235|nr:ABC-type transport auxiliary lipoprotein family protein [Achromobacter sp. Marseille-Q4962]
MKIRSVLAVLGLGLALAGCGVGRVAAPPSVFDLGPDSRPVPALPARPALALSFSAVPMLSETGVIWRVGDSAAPHSYATYQWATPPAELVRQRLADRLSRQGPLLAERASAQMPQLQVTLSRFEQVFQPDGAASEGRVHLQAVLLRGHSVLGQTRIVTRAPAPTQDAAGGVAALRAATDEAADQLAQWLSSMPLRDAGG